MDFLLRIVEWFKERLRGMDRKLLVPLMMWIIRFFSKKIETRVEGEEGLSEWKQDALRDFRFWLDDLPDMPSATEAATKESCDLYTLLSEFSALRQEIKLQNREQEKSLQSFDVFMNTYREAVDMFRQKSEELKHLEENVRAATEKKTVLPFLDIRDSLVRGYKASKEVADVKGIFTSAPRGIEGVIEGYEMAIRRFDRALEMVGIQPVETEDHPFDPKTMKARERRSAPDKEKGIVIEELLSGFVRGGEVIRFAEVVVSV